MNCYTTRIFLIRFVCFVATCLLLTEYSKLYSEVDSVCKYSELDSATASGFDQEISSSSRSTQSSTLLKMLAETSVSDATCDRYFMILDKYLRYDTEEADLVFQVLDSPSASIYTKLSLLEMIGLKWEQNFNFEVLFSKYITKRFESFKRNPNFLLKLLETLCLLKPINASSFYILLRPFFLDSTKFNPEMLKLYKNLVLHTVRYLTPSSSGSVVFEDFRRLYLMAFNKETDDGIKLLFIENFANLGLFEELNNFMSNPKYSDIVKVAACSSSYHAKFIPDQEKKRLTVYLTEILENTNRSFILKKMAYITLAKIKALPSCNNLFSSTQM